MKVAQVLEMKKYTPPIQFPSRIKAKYNPKRKNYFAMFLDMIKKPMLLSIRGFDIDA